MPYSVVTVRTIKVGVYVSREHVPSNPVLFPVDDAPNILNHDFPIPGYLIIPCEYIYEIAEQV